MKHNDKTVDNPKRKLISPRRIKHATATSITQIRFKNDQNTILSIDVNYATSGTISYKDINAMITTYNSNKPDNKDNRMDQSNSRCDISTIKKYSL